MYWILRFIEWTVSDAFKRYSWTNNESPIQRGLYHKLMDESYIAFTLLKIVQLSEKDVRAGNYKDSKQVFSEIKKRFDFNEWKI